MKRIMRRAARRVVGRMVLRSIRRSVGGFGPGLGTGLMLGAVGVFLVARALRAPGPSSGWGGSEAEPRGEGHLDEVRRSVDVEAPVDAVFEHWSRLDNIPRFLSRVREVRVHGDGRSTWIVDTPTGMRLQWDALTTRVLPGREIAWRSVPGTLVENAGTIRFRPNGRGGTRVDVRLGYDPRTGVAGELMARIFGAGPDSSLDEDLARMKSYFERGPAAEDAAAPAMA
jgi:uncharacterized membrane protein